MFEMDRSTGVVIRNFTIDWDVPLTAQAEVLEIDDHSILMKINKLESPYIIENGHHQYLSRDPGSTYRPGEIPPEYQDTQQ